jgi:hypothetical protein
MKGWNEYVVVLVLISISVFVQSFTYHRNSSERITVLPRQKSDDDAEVNAVCLSSQPTKQTARRSFLFHLASSGFVLVFGRSPAAHAGEIGRRITEAVTTSELGQSVRQSVIRGAQIMDQIDAQTERWSDRYHLGSARGQRDPRPRPTTVPPLRPLDAPVATDLLELADRIFLQCTRIPPPQLQTQVQRVAETVRPSFVRAGLELAATGAPIQTAPQFNFAAYVHYKAYSDLMSSSSSPLLGSFAAFQTAFELALGQQLLARFEPAGTLLAPASNAAAALHNALQRIDALSALWVQAGLVAQVERSPIAADDEEDWRQDMADLSFTIALDQDVTIPAQVLLQEQGRRLYPAFWQCLMRAILLDALRPFAQTVVMEDYYFDTDYNSDPDQFEVKQVLVNINIENAM